MIAQKNWLRRLLRWSLWGAATLISLYILLCVWLRWSGGRAQERLQTRLQETGETLDFKALLPPAVDPARNFFTLEPLQDISSVIDGDASKGVPAKKRQALEQMKMRDTSVNPVLLNGVKMGAPVEINTLSQWLLKVKPKALALPDQPSLSAEDIRQALEKAFPNILAFANAVDASTQAEFSPSLAERPLPENLFALQIPQYAALNEAERPILWHGLAAAATGKGDEALRDARVLLRFATACQREPLLISLLVASSKQSTAIELLWHVLRERNAGEDALRAVQEELSTPWEPITLQAFRGEMASAASGTRMLERASGGERAMMLSYVSADGVSNAGIAANTSFGLLPNGFFALSGAHLVQSELDMLILPLKKGGIRELLATGPGNEAALIEMKSHPFASFDSILTAMMIPAIQGIAQKAAVAEVRRQQAVIACALERWHLKNKSYPESLQALVPQLLDKVPSDLFDGKPMRYRQTAAGRYLLWSIAFDGKDDNGKVNLNAHAVVATASMYQSAYAGDWAWQYEPVK